jgi:hypothetical protein
MIAPDATGDKPLFCAQSAIRLGAQNRSGYCDKAPLKSPKALPKTLLKTLLKALALRRFGRLESRIR